MRILYLAATMLAVSVVAGYAEDKPEADMRGEKGLDYQAYCGTKGAAPWMSNPSLKDPRQIYVAVSGQERANGAVYRVCNRSTTTATKLFIYEINADPHDIEIPIQSCVDVAGVIKMEAYTMEEGSPTPGFYCRLSQ